MSHKLNHPEYTFSESEKRSIQIGYYNAMRKSSMCEPMLFALIKEYWCLAKSYKGASKSEREALLASISLDQKWLDEFFIKLASAKVSPYSDDIIYSLHEHMKDERANEQKHGLSSEKWENLRLCINNIKNLVPSIKRELQRIEETKIASLASEKPLGPSSLPDV